jgi:leucyl-tRNA---protein transferase
MDAVDWTCPAETEARAGTTPRISEYFMAGFRTPEQMDTLWSHGWRRLGFNFMCYSFAADLGPLLVVQPLRVPLCQTQLRRSQRRILRKNSDLTVKVGVTRLDRERDQLFQQHKRRFRTSIPESLKEFLGPCAGERPCQNVEVAVFGRDRLLAASYLDVGKEGAASLYAMFALSEARRSLGIYTMLLEIAYARTQGCRYYYSGYAFHEPSYLDYKKQFAGMEWYDWRGNWLPLNRLCGPARSQGQPPRPAATAPAGAGGASAVSLL